MTDQEKRDFYKQHIAEMLDGVKCIGVLNAICILIENITEEDENEDIESRN